MNIPYCLAADISAGVKNPDVTLPTLNLSRFQHIRTTLYPYAQNLSRSRNTTHQNLGQRFINLYQKTATPSFWSWGFINEACLLHAATKVALAFPNTLHVLGSDAPYLFHYLNREYELISKVKCPNAKRVNDYISLLFLYGFLVFTAYIFLFS